MKEWCNGFDTTSGAQFGGIPGQSYIVPPRHSPHCRRTRPGERAGNIFQLTTFDFAILLGQYHRTWIDYYPVSLDIKHLKLAKKYRLIDHATGSKTKNSFVRLCARRNLAQNNVLAIDADGVPRIWSATPNEPRKAQAAGQQRDDFAFSFGSILAPNYDGCWHDTPHLFWQPDRYLGRLRRLLPETGIITHSHRSPIAGAYLQPILSRVARKFTRFIESRKTKRGSLIPGHGK
jgi:hypothetical protein